MFLKVVTFPGDVSDDFLAIGQAHFGNFAKSGVGLFRGAGHDLHANAAALRTIDESRRLGFDDDFFAALADKLVDGWHLFSNKRF
jgi:hypothetical protein